MLVENLMIAAGMIVAVVTIQSVGVYVIQHLLDSDRAKPWREGRPHRQGMTVIFTVFGLLVLHSLEIWAYAFLYDALGQFEDFEASLYFSVTTFTTLGYGDIALDASRRLIAGTEGLIGLILIGWSTAILVSLTTRMGGGRHDQPGDRAGEAPQEPNSP